MPASPAHPSRLLSRRGAALLVLLSLAASAQAQQLQRFQRVQIVQGVPLPFGLFQQEPRRLELTAPHVDLIFGPTANRLAQARALAADKNWDEAIDLFRELSADSSDRVVALDDGRFVSLRTYCHLQLAHLPAEALAAYRRRVDALAERWYRDGLAARDESLLRRVIDELFCSSWGDDALLALGEFTLERGDVAAARRHWQQISPLMRDPVGRPLWLSLRGIDLDKHWPAIERRWLIRPQPPTWLAYPDTDLDLADVRARLVLASVRAGDFDRAALELDTFRRWHPNATGRLGGQLGPYSAALERLLSSARQWPASPPDRDWPAFAGAQSRAPHAAPVGPLARTAWPQARQIVPSNVVQFQRSASGAIGQERNPPGQLDQQSVRESEQPLSYFPVVVDRLLLYADATTVHAVDLETGRPAITPNGELYRAEATAGDVNTALMRTQAVGAGVPRHSLAVIGDVVYARLGRITTAQLQPAPPPIGERLVGLDLKRDGLLTFQVRPDDERWSFDGVPVGDGRRVYVAMRHGDVTPHAYVACFNAATGRRLWRTSIGAADTPASGTGDEITHNLLALVGDRIYFNTNLGLVAALDAQTGRIDWLRRYERSAAGPSSAGPGGPLHLDRDPSPCLVHDGLVIVAPSDSPAVFALDADTGRLIWSSGQLADALHLLGVVDDSLVVTGNRFRSVDIASGRVRFVWPESEHAGIRGMGRGVLAGNEVFWPTRKEIYVFDARTGARTRPTIDLAPVSACGANLIAAQGYLVVAGRDRLLATGPRAPQPPDRSPAAPKVADAN